MLRQIERTSVRRMAKRYTDVRLQGMNPTIGFAASLFAVWCQILLLATISLAPLANGPDALGNVPICHADGGTQPAPQNPGQPAHDCALCVLCLSHALPMGVLSPTPTLPDPQSIAVVRLDAARARAPPVRLAASAQPRGPPSLI
jgi:hypothetical protein